MKASTAVSSSSSVSSHKSAAPPLAFSPKIVTFFFPNNVLPLTCHVVPHSLSYRPSPMLHPLYPPVPLAILVYKYMLWDIPIIYFEDATIATKLLPLPGVHCSSDPSCREYLM